MTLTNETLFDLTPYGGVERSSELERTTRVEPPVEPLAPGWRFLRNRGGVVPYAHLIKSQSSNGSVLTRCDLAGTTLTNDGIAQMRRCPLCDLDLQLI